MIQANELRLGNYVWAYDDFVIIRHLGIYGLIAEKGGIIVNSGYSNVSIKPITLTEEILLKCGFEDDEFLSTYFELDNPHIMLGIYMDDDGIKINHMWFDIKLEYLHQLQNLYFSLSGKELEINV